MSRRRLLAVHAHPDDESISMGGTLAVCHDRGITTSIICCTDGKLATIVPEDLPEETTRPRLAEIRKDELRAACKALSVDELHFLDYGDSGMAGEPSNGFPDAFWRADIEEAISRVVGHIRRFQPHVVVTYDANGGYGHPDHIQAHRVTVLAVEAAHQPTMYPDAGTPWTVKKLYYTAFPKSAAQRAISLAKEAGMPPPFGVESVDELPFATDDEFVTTTVDIGDGLSRKREAMRAHHSQISEDFPLLAIPEDIIREHFGQEYFQLAISRVPTSLPENDLFNGIRATEMATPLS